MNQKIQIFLINRTGGSIFFSNLCVFISSNDRNGEGNKWRGSQLQHLRLSFGLSVYDLLFHPFER